MKTAQLDLEAFQVCNMLVVFFSKFFISNLVLQRKSANDLKPSGNLTEVFFDSENDKNEQT